MRIPINLLAGVDLWLDQNVDPKVIKLLKLAGTSPKKIVRHILDSLDDASRVDADALHDAVASGLA